jgi:hypothetical protein
LSAFILGHRYFGVRFLEGLSSLALGRSLLSDCLAAFRQYPVTTAVAMTASVLAVTAIVNRQLAEKARRDNPPQGRFIDIDGVRLHYVERGKGRPVVLFHGNGSMIQDFESSGLIDLAAETTE